MIAALRELIGMDQEAFGVVLGGWSQGKISRYERMQSEPPIGFWVILVKMFGVNLSWAFTGRGEPWCSEFEDTEESKRIRGRLEIVMMLHSKEWQESQREIGKRFLQRTKDE